MAFCLCWRGQRFRVLLVCIVLIQIALLFIVFRRHQRQNGPSEHPRRRLSLALLAYPGRRGLGGIQRMIGPERKPEVVVPLRED